MFGKLTPEKKAAMKARFEQMLSEAKDKQSEALQTAPHAKADSDEESNAGGEENGNHPDSTQPPTRDEASTNAASEMLAISASSPTVEVTNIRLFTLEELDLDALHVCTSLSLRKNLIHELTPLPLHLANRLTELDLFDNKIRKMGDFFVTATVHTPSPDGPLLAQPCAHAFCALTKLDLSYNQIHKIDGLDSLGATLKELYLVENKIKTISGLHALVNLEVLELGGNRIRELGDGLATLVNLRQLWLGKNKISSLGTALQPLRALTLVSLQANRLTAITPENFLEGAHPALRELYLSENGLSSIENVPLHTLHILDYSFNPIKSLNTAVLSVENLPELEEFWLTDGKIDSWDEVARLASFAATMKTVYLERNPIEEDKRYRDKVYMYLPFIKQIDSWAVVNKGNLEADRAIQRRS